MRQEKVIETIREMSDQIPHHHVYFTMRLLGMRRIMPATVNLAKVCITVEELGLPITINIISSITGKSGIDQRLHTLGDKGFLQLIEHENRQTKWKVNPVFMETYRK